MWISEEPSDDVREFPQAEQRLFGDVPEVTLAGGDLAVDLGALTLFHTHSSGFSSGEQGGRMKMLSRPSVDATYSFTALAVWTELPSTSTVVARLTAAWLAIDGLAAAAAQGRTGGRLAVVDPDTLAVAIARRARGESVTAIATHLQ